MLGHTVAPRWRLPVLLLAALLLQGCSGHKEIATDESGMPIPTVKMALVKIPLNGKSSDNLLDNMHPAERFATATTAVSNTHNW